VNWDDPIVEGAATDTGMRRTNNQDSLAIVRATTPETFKARGHLFMVADGMGAHAVGEMASKLACDYIPHTYLKARNGTPAEALTKAYQDVGAQIYAKAQANPDFHRMGTTCTTLVLLPAGALVAHVGDSRVYRIRDGRIDQLSFDHSLVWELVRKGHMTAEQAQKAYPRNVITRSLGPEPTVEVDIEGPLPVAPGDVYLVCSDGLSGLVRDPEIGAFAAHLHPEEACRDLLHLANLRGGVDNISIIVVRIGPWVEPGSEAQSDGGAEKGKKSRGSFLSGLLGSLKGKPQGAGVEENLYQSAECPLDKRLLASVDESVKNAQGLAIDQTWVLDWSELTRLRREAGERFQAGDLRGSLRSLGEAIAVLGQAGRQHRREVLNQGRI
jgi:serine/threonine protein phosphatase PrpC